MPSIALTLSVRGQLLSGTRAFSPINLFASNEAGIWLDPSDLTTMFTDTAGTTPVTAAGQTAALALDKSKGLVLGSELVTNGDFSSGGTGWTLGAGWTVPANELVGTSVTAGTYATSAAFSVVAGRGYRVTLSATVTSGSFSVRFDNSAQEINLGTISASGSYSFFVLAPDALAVIGLRSVSAFTGTIDNISVRELSGNHATQATAASRPTYGVVPSTGRRNLLTFTEQFDNAAWGNFQTTETANAGVAPDGTATAEKLILDNAQTSGSIFQIITGLSAATAYSGSVYMKAAEFSALQLTLVARNGASEVGRNIITVDLNAGTGAVSSTGTAWTSVLSAITNAGNGWWRVALSGVTPATTSRVDLAPTFSGVTGNGTSGVLIWGAQLELGSTASNYQRVVSAFDVTEAGVQSLGYLSFDGVDDFLVTPTITPATDKAQVFAGVRKLSDAATGVIAEHSVNSGSNTGAWGLFSGGYGAGAAAYAANVYGSQRTSFDATTFAAPISNVLTSTFDIAGAARADEIGVRVNGVLPTLTGGGNTNAGTGNFSAQAIYIGRKAGTSAPFNGNLFSLVVRFGANLDAATITSTETWVNSKTGAY